jgi:CheY-like chemotaxis protein
MDEETLHHAFEPFFTQKALGEGSGLGLSIVHGVLAQSGGFVDVTSTPGAGSTFTVLFPLVEEVATAPVSSVRAVRPPNAAARILVVEDEPLVQNVIRRILSRDNHEVVVSANGAEALGLLEGGDQRFDLLVTDVVMPRMTGPALVQAMAEKGITLPVVYVTGYAEDHLVRHGVSSASTVLEKPFTADALLDAVRAALPNPPK